jgi:hypothetical protein
MATIRASIVSAPSFSARITSDDVPFTVPPTRRLFRRHGFAGDHGFVHGAAAFKHHAIDGHALAGTDSQAVAYAQFCHGDFFVVAGRAQAARGFGGERQQGADGAAGAVAGA